MRRLQSVKFLILFPKLDGTIRCPVGPLAVASWCDQNGVSSFVFDDRLYPPQVANEIIASMRPEWIGLSVMTGQIPGALDLIRRYNLERFKDRLYIGGIHAALWPDQVDRWGVAAPGMGEAFMSNRFGLPAFDIDDLSVRFPCCDLETYIRTHRSHCPDLAGLRMVAVNTARGCSRGCAFCVQPKLAWSKWRGRPARAVVEEIGVLKHGYGVDAVHLQDEYFLGGDEGRAEEIVESLAARGLLWHCILTVRDVTADRIGRWRRAGLRSVAVGLEAGTDEALRALRKNHTVAEALEACRVLADAGVFGDFCFMTGLPIPDSGEVDLATLGMVEKIKSMFPPGRCVFPGPAGHVYRPIPGTTLGDAALEGVTMPASLLEWDHYFRKGGAY